MHRTLVILLAGAAVAVAAPRRWRGLVRTSNTQVHRVNQ
jgi:hypothetical protein